MERLTLDAIAKKYHKDELDKIERDKLEAKIIKHLDKVVKVTKNFVKITSETIELESGGELSYCSAPRRMTTFKGLGSKSLPYVQTYSGLREIAKMLCFPIEEHEKRGCEGDKYIEVTMIYKDVIFLELEDVD